MELSSFLSYEALQEKFVQLNTYFFAIVVTPSVFMLFQCFLVYFNTCKLPLFYILRYLTHDGLTRTKIIRISIHHVTVFDWLAVSFVYTSAYTVE